MYSDYNNQHRKLNSRKPPNSQIISKNHLPNRHHNHHNQYQHHHHHHHHLNHPNNRHYQAGKRGSRNQIAMQPPFQHENQTKRSLKNIGSSPSNKLSLQSSKQAIKGYKSQSSYPPPILTSTLHLKAQSDDYVNISSQVIGFDKDLLN